jgi:hypothetical protein
MSNRIFIIVLIGLILAPLMFYANGGPVDMGRLRKTGNIRLLRKADVKLLSEDLKIKIVGDYTEIEVDYQLKNNGDPQQIQYGFPVDAYDEDWHFGESAWPMFEGGNKIVEYFNVFANGAPMKTAAWVEDSVYAAQSVNLNEGYYAAQGRSIILRKWFTTSIHFDKGETIQLKVLYKVKNTLRDKIPGFCFVNRITDRHFTYDLSPSSNWGDGIVHQFNLSIDLTDSSSIGVDYAVHGIDNLKLDNKVYSYSAMDYDLNQSDRIDIHYNNSHIKMAEFIQDNDLPKGIVKSIRSSSDGSDAKNLLDNSPFTTWTGVQGDWIEIEFQRMPRKNGNGNIVIAGILALNGDYSGKDHFEKSGRMKNVKVIVNDKVEFNTMPWEKESGNTLIHLDKPVFKDVDAQYVSGLATIVADGDGLGCYRVDHVFKIRIEIMSVDGNAGKGVTLSELYFVGR